METKINKKSEAYVSNLKDMICGEIKLLPIEPAQKTSLLEKIYEHPRLLFDKDDFSKRKRVKNTIPSFDRCSAKLANGEQCTRRHKKSSEYCGTHNKNAPHGQMQTIDTKNNTIEIFTQDINGITQYIDHNNNIYRTDEIMKDSERPSIIGKYKKLENGDYSIDVFY